MTTLREELKANYVKLNSGFEYDGIVYDIPKNKLEVIAVVDMILSLEMSETLGKLMFKGKTEMGLPQFQIEKSINNVIESESFLQCQEKKRNELINAMLLKFSIIE